MPTAQQNQLLGALFGGGQLFNQMGVADAGAMQPGMPDMIAAPGFPESPLASPGGPDRVPIFQQGRPAVDSVPTGPGGAFFGVQENAPDYYASTPGFSPGGRMSPSIQPRNPNLNLEALLGMSKKNFGNSDPFQQAAFNQLFTSQEQLLGTLQNYGVGALGETEQAFKTQQNKVQGELAKRGLMGSNAYSAAATSVERERQQALNTLSDQLLGRKFDVMAGFGKSIADLAAGIGGANQQAKLQKDLQKAAQGDAGIGTKGGGLVQQAATSGLAYYNRSGKFGR